MGTALITGATSGIGKELAWQLAAGKHDLVLVARTRADLDALAAQIHQLAGVGVQVIAADLSQSRDLEIVAQRLRTGKAGAVKAAARPHTSAQVAARAVDLLVNNAGFAVGQAFVRGDLAQEQRALAVMVEAVMTLTHAAVPGMVSRGYGGILNVSSVTALTAMGTYAAHKAWVRTFTEGLAGELKGTGVRVTEVNPGLTRTQFHTRAHLDSDRWPRCAWLEAPAVAASALAALRRGQVICTPSLRYQAVNAALRLSPRWLVRRVAGPYLLTAPR